ncbi:MAG: hypothetical protein FWG39_01975 [Alphaproteobacteria bacterium]|nr:hypothetical protein [Alphaproteobacteria bacterium]
MKKLFNIFAIMGILAGGAATAETLDATDTQDVPEIAEIAEPAAAAVVKETAKPVESVAEQADEEDAAARNPKTKFPRGMQAGLGVSATSGLGGFVGYANKDFESFWWKRIGGRVEFATSSPIQSTLDGALESAVDGIDMGDLNIKNPYLTMHHFGAIADIYPFGNTWFLGGWRLSGGYVVGKTKMGASVAGKIDGAPSDPFEFELDGIEYRYNGGDITARADVNWKYSGPYLGTGFDLGLFWGIKIFTDFGVVFTKAPKAALDIPLTDKLQYWNGSAWTNVGLSGPAADAFNNAKNEVTDDANRVLGDITFYPMVKLGLMYRF